MPDRKRELSALLTKYATSLRVAAKYEELAKGMSDSPATEMRNLEAAQRNFTAADDTKRQIIALFDEVTR